MKMTRNHALRGSTFFCLRRAEQQAAACYLFVRYFFIYAIVCVSLTYAAPWKNESTPGTISNGNTVSTTISTTWAVSSSSTFFYAVASNRIAPTIFGKK
jgi:hypothetical protein